MIEKFLRNSCFWKVHIVAWFKPFLALLVSCWTGCRFFCLFIAETGSFTQESLGFCCFKLKLTSLLIVTRPDECHRFFGFFRMPPLNQRLESRLLQCQMLQKRVSNNFLCDWLVDRIMLNVVLYHLVFRLFWPIDCWLTPLRLYCLLFDTLR